MAKLRCGLIGWPVEHSLSPKLHAYAAKSRGIDLSYELFPVEAAGVRALVIELSAKGYTGLNVTTPHKEAVLSELDWLERQAELIGAVNTIHFDGIQKRGYNTDCTGMCQLVKDIHIDYNNSQIGRTIIIGTGPAGRAVAMGCAYTVTTVIELFYKSVRPVLKDDDPDVTYWCTKLSRIEDLDLYMETERNDGWYGDDLIINATPLGGRERAMESPWPQRRPLPTHSWVMDLNYNPPLSRFLHDARKAGNWTMNGLGLLCYQAADSFNIWTGSDVTGKELLDYLIAEGHDAALSNGR